MTSVAQRTENFIFLFVPIGPAAIFWYSEEQIGPNIDLLGGPETRQVDLWQTEM